MINDSFSLLILSFAIAFMFGFIANKSNFCTLGAIADIFNMGDWTRMRMWLLSMSIAILGTSLLIFNQLIDIHKTIYLINNKIYWLSHLVGGLCFGVGMTLASGCGNKTLLRLGTGNLKSLLVLFSIAISAYATLKGLLGAFRVNILQSVSIDLNYPISLTHILSNISLIKENINSFGILSLILAGFISLALWIFCFKNQSFRQEKTLIISSILIGLLVPLGYYITGNLGFEENIQTLEMEYFLTNTHSPESFSFIAPIAYSLELFLLWTDSSTHFTFGIVSILGVILGAWMQTQRNRSFQVEHFTRADDFINHMVGGFLMGFGGVCALGCTIGQGLSGIATLSIGSFISVFSIILGSYLTMKYQYLKS